MKRAGPAAGMSLPPPTRLSKYSMMTTLSYRIVPSSVTSVGILLSGFSAISAGTGLSMATTVRTVWILSARPSSCAAIITLRT